VFSMSHAVVYIGENLKRLRLSRTLTQRELAAKSGVSLRSIVLLENDRQEPYPSTLRKLANGLDVDPSRLIEGRPL
jgi:transcriptional regulator with XRE-family HTH domain